MTLVGKEVMIWFKFQIWYVQCNAIFNHTNKTLVLIWVQTVCKGYQQTTLVGKELIPIVFVTEERPLSPETPVTTPGRGKKKKKKTEGETEDEALSPSEDVASPRKGKKKKKKPATDGEVSRDV